MKTIAEHMRDMMIEDGVSAVMWGDGVLVTCAYRAGCQPGHPLNKMVQVLDALERTKSGRELFVKGYVSLDGAFWQSGASRRVRSFRLREKPEGS